MPLYELLEKLFILFDMQLIEKQDAYICAFYDAVTEYMQNNSSELTAFISYWDEHLHEKTIPSGESTRDSDSLSISQKVWSIIRFYFPSATGKWRMKPTVISSGVR